MTIFNGVQSSNDTGTFTVQSVDIPLGAKVQTKPRFTKAEVKSKKARLTPINEYDEFDKIEFDTKSVLSFDSMICNQDFAMDHISAFNDIDNDMLCYEANEQAFHRTDTPVILSRRKKKPTRVEERFEEELRMISEHSDQEQESSSYGIVTDLPPRPKARLEVLPPDITGNHNTDHKKKRRVVRRLRQKVDEVGGTSYKSSLISNSLSSFGAKADDVKRNKLSLLTRPQSADSGVRIINSVAVPKIQKSKSTSFPDLPTVMNRLAKSKLKGDFKSSYEDSGALGTPREARTERNNTKCLRGSDMSSFYHMWEKARVSRVIGRQSPEKMNSPSPTFQRPCASFHKHEARKHHFLPPL